MIKVYEGDKMEVLASFLSVDVGLIRVWSDNSLTLGDDLNVEYFVTAGKRKYSELLGKVGKYNVYRNA